MFVIPCSQVVLGHVRLVDDDTLQTRVQSNLSDRFLRVNPNLLSSAWCSLFVCLYALFIQGSLKWELFRHRLNRSQGKKQLLLFIRLRKRLKPVCADPRNVGLSIADFCCCFFFIVFHPGSAHILCSKQMIPIIQTRMSLGNPWRLWESYQLL